MTPAAEAVNLSRLGVLAVPGPGAATPQELRAALAGGGELHLDYQPIVACGSRRVCAVEALVRWDHPSHGALLPGDFLAMADSAGLLGVLDRWVLRRACLQAAAWRRELGDRSPVMHVNASAASVQSDELACEAASASWGLGLPAGAVCVEVTEGVIARSDNALRTLQELRHNGFALAIDDFGCGHSSLGRLLDMPVDVLKLDRCLIRDLHRDHRPRAILRAMAGMCEQLAMQLVVEGVETDAQMRVVCQTVAGSVQGHLTGRPMAPTQITALLAV